MCFQKKQMNERQFCILTASSGPVAKSSSSLDIEETNFPWKIEEKRSLFWLLFEFQFLTKTGILFGLEFWRFCIKYSKLGSKFCFKFYSPLKFEIVTKFQTWASLARWKVHWTSVLMVMGSDPSGFWAHWQMYDVQILNDWLQNSKIEM